MPARQAGAVADVVHARVVGVPVTAPRVVHGQDVGALGPEDLGEALRRGVGVGGDEAPGRRHTVREVPRIPVAEELDPVDAEDLG